MCLPESDRTPPSDAQPPVPYPPIERHGVVGDRRTAALVAADGTVDWLCLLDYDGATVFGALLDAARGGFWRFGPATPTLGRQGYEPGSAVLTTTWETAAGNLELTDSMAWPDDDRPPGGAGRRVLVRRLRCTQGGCDVVCDIQPRLDFAAGVAPEDRPNGLTFSLGAHRLGLWTDRPLAATDDGATATFRLAAGEEAWAVLAHDEDPSRWNARAAAGALDDTRDAWRDWDRRLVYTGPRGERVRRAAMTVRLLAYAPTGALVAAPTTSLPERIGGDRNYDYRFAWVRDASLSLAILSLLGDTAAARRYMDWLAGLGSSTDSPLQVVYRVDGRTDLTQVERSDLAGYRESRPVRIGNHAYAQRQIDSLGYLADCALIYLNQGGLWRAEYWDLIRAAAEYTAANWRLPDSGIWELPAERHYLSSKVMGWVALDRAVRIALKMGHATEADRWVAEKDTIHAEVMDRGWSDQLGAFRQRYEADTLDAAALLIPVMGFLPADHPCVLATADRIAERLAIDGLVHRFLAGETPGHADLPLGEFEGTFLPCTFWLATTYAKAGRVDVAEAILHRVEETAGELGLFAEEIDARSGAFLGNTPLVFAQVEYVRAVLELGKARPLGKARLLVGMAEQRIKRLVRGGRPTTAG
jgi:GH15 family glucan-1,4-alpha-glucosidase